VFRSIQSASEIEIEIKMIEIIYYLIVVILVVLWCYIKWSNRHFEKLAARMPGPLSYPIIGTGYKFIGSPERNENNIFLKIN